MMVPDNMVQISTSAPGTGYTSLKPFLYKQQRQVDRVLGDGNCLFRALSKAISGTEDHHPHLRHAISDFESDNWTVFKPIHEAIISTNFENHIKNIKKLYIWGTSTEIVAAATLFQVEVYVATDSYRQGIPTWLVHTPKPVSLLKNTPITYLNRYNLNLVHGQQRIELTHISSIHFDTTKPIKGFKLKRPQLEGTASRLNLQ